MLSYISQEKHQLFSESFDIRKICICHDPSLDKFPKPLYRIQIRRIRSNIKSSSVFDLREGETESKEKRNTKEIPDST